MKATFTLLLMLISACCCRVVAQDAPARTEVDFEMAPVVVDGVPLFRVRGMSLYSAEKRAASVAQAIRQAAEDPAIQPGMVSLTNEGSRIEVFCGAHRIFAAVVSEAREEQLALENYALFARQQIMDAIKRYRHEREPAVLRERALKAVGMGVVALLLLLLWIRTVRAFNRFFDSRVSNLVKDIQLQSYQIVRRQHIWRFLQFLLSFAQWLGIALLLYVLVFEILDLFPWTRALSHSLLQHLVAPLRRMAEGMLSELPNLFFLTVLVLVVRFVLRLVKGAFQNIESRQIHFANFEPDWAMPTYRLVRLLIIVFALIMAYPYIPGSSSEAFKACSVFFGLLFSLGASSLVGNIIAGYSVTYRRAFRVGDLIKAGDHVGEVHEIRLMATRLRTLKNEEVVIPNSKLIGEEVLNYSALSARHGLILHTCVGIGYEVSWRKVEAMLLESARMTTGLDAGGAFVRIRQLGDFAVVYELNVPCSEPRRMQAFYTELHKNILDAFNKYKVQIMTPAYEGDPDQPKIVPAERWHEAPAVPPAPPVPPRREK